MGPIEVQTTPPWSTFPRRTKDVEVSFEVQKDSEYFSVSMPPRKALQLAAEILLATGKALLRR